MEQQPYKVYIQADGQGRITAVNSSEFLPSPVPEGWTEIDSGYGDRYHHAQGNYFDGPVTDERGVYRYAYVPDAGDGAPRWRERSREERDADYVPPVAVPTLEVRVEAVETRTDELAGVVTAMMGGIADVS